MLCALQYLLYTHTNPFELKSTFFRLLILNFLLISSTISAGFLHDRPQFQGGGDYIKTVVACSSSTFRMLIQLAPLTMQRNRRTLTEVKVSQIIDHYALHVLLIAGKAIVVGSFSECVTHISHTFLPFRFQLILASSCPKSFDYWLYIDELWNASAAASSSSHWWLFWHLCELVWVSECVCWGVWESGSVKPVALT